MARKKAEPVFALPKPKLYEDLEDLMQGLKFPVFAQPNFSGLRCTATVKGGKVVFGTGAGETYHPLESPALKSLETALEGIVNVPVVIDGVLRHPSASAGAIEDKLDGLKDLTFICTDIVDSERPFNERLQKLYKLVGYTGSIVTTAPTTSVFKMDSLKQLHSSLIRQGYTGMIVRPPDSMYEMKGETDSIRLLETFLSGEFTVKTIRVYNKQTVFVCEVPDTQEEGLMIEFPVSISDKLPEYPLVFCGKQNLLIGKRVNVRFQGLHGPNKIPFSATAVKFLDPVEVKGAKKEDGKDGDADQGAD